MSNVICLTIFDIKNYNIIGKVWLFERTLQNIEFCLSFQNISCSVIKITMLDYN